MIVAQRTGVVLRPNPQRVLSRLFIPGEEELIRGTSRAQNVLKRCLVLSEEQVVQTLELTLARFNERHRNLRSQLELHYAAVEGLIETNQEISDARKMLIGAYFTQEYAFESSAYFNPSIVAHPDQSGLSYGYLRIILSVRAVGEGHISSLVFRTGIINPAGELLIDSSPRYATTHAKRYSALRNRHVRQVAIEAGIDISELDLVLGMLPDKFTPQELDVTLSQLNLTDHATTSLITIADVLHKIAGSSYEVDFDAGVRLSEQVLWPTAADERRGIEDARWVKITEDNGDAIYRASYTGFDGQAVTSRVFETHGFRNYSSTNLSGKAIANKGLAFFPRKVNGKYLALSRWDRETNSITYSDDGYHWNDSKTFQEARQPWELVHIGNCGSPIETPEGWLVITHGTGPMREYSIGAILLDLDEPTKILKGLDYPLISANAEERDGYVPNVVYSCGSLIHNETLFIPYGFSDNCTGVATVNVPELLDSMVHTK